MQPVTVFIERFRAAVSVHIGPCCPALLELYSCKCAYCCIIGQIKWWRWWWCQCEYCWRTVDADQTPLSRSILAHWPATLRPSAAHPPSGLYSTLATLLLPIVLPPFPPLLAVSSFEHDPRCIKVEKKTRGNWTEENGASVDISVIWGLSSLDAFCCVLLCSETGNSYEICKKNYISSRSRVSRN